MAFEQKELQDYIGRGITLPLQLVNGRVPLKSGFELIQASIIMILSWPYSTRYFLSEFGSRLEDLLEEPNDDILSNLIETFVIDSIKTWEPRVTLMSIDLQRVENKINVQLTYRIVASNKDYTFVYPFYTQINY